MGEENELKADSPSIIGPAPPSLDLPEMVPLPPRGREHFYHLSSLLNLLRMLKPSDEQM